MTDNVVIAIIAVSGVVLSAITVLGGAVFAYIASNRNLDNRFANVDTKFANVDKRLDKIDHTLELIQSDMKLWSEQIFKIKAHIKMD